jgi:phenylacetate-CoA ligase
VIEKAALPLTALLDQLRRFINWSPPLYALMNTGAVQPLLTYLGRIKARGVYEKARRHAPAYRAFLAEQGVRVRVLEDVPVTDKANYVKAYSVEERCYGGRIPPFGSVIDESSGSSGVPNNWVRGPEERARATRELQLNYGLMFGDASYFLINCFALGPWATGMNVSMSLSNVGILKSIGPDRGKLENTLRLFGPKYRYLIFGYPPFIKQFVDNTDVPLASYDLHAIVGGEGISEALRTHLLESFKTVLSSYGASDLEINLGTETELTIALRKACMQDRSLCLRLFGRDAPPMIFQYNPIDHYIESTVEGELLFTITRLSTAAPKVRYNLHDSGGIITYNELQTVLAEYPGHAAVKPQRVSHFPILYLFGRSDMTVPFYGAKVSPMDLEAVVNERCGGTVNSFQFGREDGPDGEARLLVRLECRQGVSVPMDTSELHACIFDGLRAVNQDFREVTRMFPPDRVIIEVYAFEQGPFAVRDIRIKSKYTL